MFLVRPLPQPFESLSSWRQRAGIANGFTRFPRLNNNHSWLGIDRVPKQPEFNWLMSEYHLSHATIFSTTLEANLKHVSSSMSATGNQRWIIPVGNRCNNSSGPVFCPQCLRDDATPYFRIYWRFAFLSHCHSHHCGLLDHCPGCGITVWPANLRAVGKASWCSFRLCPQCDYDLGNSHYISRGVGDVSNKLWHCAIDGAVPPTLSQATKPLEIFQAVWSICQLLLRSGSSQLWNVIPDDIIGEGISPLNTNLSANTVELLNNKERSTVVSAAYWLLEEWPNRFAEAAHKANISRTHFISSRGQHPPWLDSFISNSLSRKKFGITKEQVETAVKKVELSGYKVSKSAVKRTLGVSESKVLNEIFGQRRCATTTEFLAICGKFEHRLSTATAARSQYATLLRDYLIFMTSVLTTQHIEEVCTMSESAVRDTLKEGDVVSCDNNSLRKLLTVRARQINKLYEIKIRSELLKGAINNDRWFICRGGEAMLGHSVRDRVVKLMKNGFAKELWTSADVFITLLTINS